MMNNNTQVSPGNRVDFSRIRKAQQEVKISKFAIGGITHQSGDWYNTIFSSFKQQMLQELAAAKTLEEKQAIINKYNNQQAAYGKLRPQFTNLSSVDFNQSVKDYQDLINNNFSFVNASCINNGVISNRYKKIGSTNRIGKDLSDKWESDGYWGGQTQDRTTLGYSGDWDENSDAFKNWQNELKNLGMETYLDADNTYKLRLLPGQLAQTVSSTNTENSQPVSTQASSWEPVDYAKELTTPQRKFRFPTFPLYNAALLGVANITNKRILDTQLKAPGMRYQAPTLYGKVTDAYTTRSQNEQALKERQWAQEQMADNTSDYAESAKIKGAIRDAELQTKLVNNQEQQQEYNQTSQNLENINNTNKQNWSNTANLNRQAYVGEARDRLNAIAQYQAQRGQNIQENIMSNYNDWKAWNRNNALQDYADWQAGEQEKVTADLQKAWDIYSNSSDISKFKGYTDFWNQQYTGGAIGKGAIRNDQNSFASAYANWLGKDGVDNEASRLKFYNENKNNSAFATELNPLNEAFEKYQADAGANYYKATNAINTRWGLIKARNNPINFDGEVSSWLYYKMNPRPSYNPYDFQYMAKGGRFLEYLRHNRRAEKEIRDTTMKSMQESRKMLKRDLDALDRESLLLLRAIFK